MRRSKFGRADSWSARLALALPLLLSGALLMGAGAGAFADTLPKFGKIIAVTFITVDTRAIAKGAALLKTLAEAARQESGDTEFTVLQQIDRPYRFATIGVWKNSGALLAHQSSAAVNSFNKAFEAVATSPPDEHDLQDIVFELPASVSSETHAPDKPQPINSAAAKPASKTAVFMLEHFDFPGVPAMVVTAVPVIEWLAHAGVAQPGAIRYQIFRQIPRKENHFQIISEWTDRAAFEAYERSTAPRKFRYITDQNGPAWRVNLYDQRLYKSID